MSLADLNEFAALALRTGFYVSGAGPLRTARWMSAPITVVVSEPSPTRTRDDQLRVIASLRWGLVNGRCEITSAATAITWAT